MILLCITVYLIFLLLPGALNSLVTRFKSCFITRVALLVIGSSLLFQLDCLTCSSMLKNVVFMDGLYLFLCKLGCIKIMFIFLFILILSLSSNVRPELPLIQLANLIGIRSLLSSNDWLGFITGWELFNLSVYLVVTISYQGALNRASVKYFLFSGLTTTFILLAVALLYSLAGTSQYDKIVFAIEMASYDKVMELLVVALLFKLGGAPLHVWAPDLYDSVPTMISLWMILIPKLAVVLFIIEFSAGLAVGLIVFVFLGVISMVGSVGLTSQWRIKRLFGYSAISNLAFILLTIGLFQHDSSLYYITIYAITTINLFAIINLLPVSGLFSVNPVLSIIYALNVFSLAGIPPLAGFYGKFLVVSSINVIGAIGVVIASGISGANYLSLVKVTLLDLPKRLFLFRCPVAVSYLISIITFIVVLASLLLVVGVQ